MWRLTLGSAYHKIVPFCEPADPLYKRVYPTTDWACATPPLPAEPEGLVVYDLVPSHPERGYCYGEVCREAVRAIDAYRAFLHVFSRYRSSLVYAFLSDECPFTDGSSADGFEADLMQLIADLPPLLRQLGDAADGLKAACVAPSRMALRGIKQNWNLVEKMIAERASERGEFANWTAVLGPVALQAGQSSEKSGLVASTKAAAEALSGLAASARAIYVGALFVAALLVLVASALAARRGVVASRVPRNLPNMVAVVPTPRGAALRQPARYKTLQGHQVQDAEPEEDGQSFAHDFDADAPTQR